MSRHSFVFSSWSLRSLELEREALERDRFRRQYQSMCVARAESYKPRGTGTLGSEPGFLCKDPLVHNALFTGDNQRVRQLFGNKWPQNLLLLASGHDLKWHSEKPEGPAWEFWQALLLGDEETLVLLISDPGQSNLHPNVIFDTSDVEQWKNYRYNLRALRIWSLCYKQEFITPLQITASRGYDKCLQHLLTSGADVDFAPGGKTALHEACENSQSECTRLLLTYGANPNSISEDGYTPLHLCTAPESLRCVELLLRFGCNVNSRTEDKGDTALHIAARFALEGHVQLYLRHGASVNRLNESEQSPLHCVCAQSHSSEDADRYFRVCHYLIEHGASVEALDEEKQSALHLACRTVNYRMVDLLLSQGIDVNRMDYGGNAPMHKALQAVAYKLEHEPERTVRSLLNYGSIRIWPGAIPKVLRFCCQSPRTIEVLVNVYDRLKVTDDWVESVPLKVLQEHQDFYESLFALSQTPRSLQHLARCAIRRHFEGHCQERIPQLPLPTFLKNYLLLQFQDYIS